MSRRHNGEGSIYPVKGGYRGYVWCTNPAGERYRKYVKGKTYDDTQRAWMKLRDEASRSPVASDVLSLENFLHYWLDEIVRPNLAPKTYEKYELFTRLHIIPHLGDKRLDKLQVKDIRQWLNKLGRICQCCAQRKDAPGQKASAAAAPQGRAATRSCLPGPVRTPATRCGPRSPAPSRNRSSPAIRGRDPLSSRRDPKRKRRSWTVEKHASSSNLPAAMTTCCTRPTSWSWSSACAKANCSGYLGAGRPGRRELYVGEQFSASAASSCAAKPRPRRPRPRFPSPASA